MSPKKKGNTAERVAAQTLSDWYGQTFKRIPSSGALRWGGITDTFGDLLVPEDFKAVVECKHRANFDLLACLTKKPAVDNLNGWWIQAIDDALRCWKETGLPRAPILLAKGNRQTPVIGIPESLSFDLDFDSTKLAYLRISNPYVPAFYIFGFDAFLKNVTPAKLKGALDKFNIHALVEWESTNGSSNSGSS